MQGRREEQSGAGRGGLGVRVAVHTMLLYYPWGASPSTVATLASQTHVGRGTGVVEPLHEPLQGAKMPYKAARVWGAVRSSREWLAGLHVVIRLFFTVVLWPRAALPLTTAANIRNTSQHLASPHLTSPSFSLFPALFFPLCALETKQPQRKHEDKNK